MMTRRLQLTAAALALCTCILACVPEAPLTRRFAITLRARSHARSPVPGTRFWANGRDLGVTDDDGLLEVELSGSEGEQVALTSSCPTGYQGSSEPRSLRLRSWSRTTANAAATTGSAAPPPTAPAKLVLEASCDAVLRTLAIVVRAQLGNTTLALHAPSNAAARNARNSELALPIAVNGELAGQTDASGVAHLLVRVAADSGVRVSLDTSKHPELLPQDPVRVFQVGRDPDLLVLDQHFTPRPRKTDDDRRSPLSKHLSLHRPYRIE